MTVSDYLASDEFRRFQDETLHRLACQAVETYLHDHAEKAAKTQLHAIPAVIQAGGLSALNSLGVNQQDKNTKQVNKKFWTFLLSLIDKTGAAPAYALASGVREELSRQGLWQDDAGITDKNEKNRLKKVNQHHLEAVLEASLPIYFEHFTCHYFYRL